MEPIYCDNHLLALEKPGSVATQPDFHEEVRNWVEKRFKKKGKAFLEPIHRIDKPVSGILLFARTSKALSRLNEAMRSRLIQRFYLARVEGELEKDEGTLIHHLIHGNFRAQVDPKGKEAILHYTSLGDGWIEVELVTGRYHQIRAQFSAIGHPIVGDGKYGSVNPLRNIALFHHKLVFPHPVGGKEVTIKTGAGFSF